MVDDETIKRRQLAFAGWLPEPDADAITSDDWYTPPELVAELDEWLGGIDLDPCWSPRSFVKPRVGFTERDNGLSRPWHGRVADVDVRTRFVNPPYSHPGPWLRALADLHNAVRPELAGESVALVRIDTSTWWWSLAWEADAICWLRARVPFVRPGSTARSQPRDHHALLYWGQHDVSFRDCWGWLGHVQLRRDVIMAAVLDELAERNAEATRPALIRDAAVRELGRGIVPELDTPSAREHERSGGHELVAIDGIPIATYPFLPTHDEPDAAADPNATTVTLSIDELDDDCRKDPTNENR